MEPRIPSFLADRMLGRLARMLRLLGYDTVYAAAQTPAEAIELARQEQRIILTRGNLAKRFAGWTSVLSVKSEKAQEQLHEVIEQFHLDPAAAATGLWTRCTRCNGLIESVEKSEVEGRVPPKVFGLYQDFRRCSGCGRVYWRGSHVERIEKKLASLLGGCEKR